MMASRSYVFRDPESSVYTAVVNTLATGCYGKWTQVDRDALTFDVMFGDRNKLPYSKLGHDGAKQLVNYYRGSEMICRKVKLNRTLKEHCHLHDMPIFSWYPTSFVVCPRVSDVEGLRPIQKLRYEASLKRDERSVLKQTAEMKKCPWIAKSSSGAKGVGIKISSDVDELLQYVDEQGASHVIQRYIDNPLLLDGDRKFDIRSWVLLDSDYKIYLFKESVLRTASDPYRPGDFSDTTSHLTNHCLQEQLSPNYGKYEEGNEMFFEEFDKFLQSKHGTSVEETVLPQIKRITKDCLLMIKENICTDHLDYHSFQLFGFDFMMDEDLKVCLLEVNGAPACAQFLQSKHGTSVEETVLPQIKRITKDCLLMIKENICTDHLDYHSFQLFGFDFMMDEDLKVCLLEVNGAPACAQMLLPDLVHSLIQTAILPHYPCEGCCGTHREMMDII